MQDNGVSELKENEAPELPRCPNYSKARQGELEEMIYMRCFKCKGRGRYTIGETARTCQEYIDMLPELRERNRI